MVFTFSFLLKKCCLPDLVLEQDVPGDWDLGQHAVKPNTPVSGSLVNTG